MNLRNGTDRGYGGGEARFHGMVFDLVSGEALRTFSAIGWNGAVLSPDGGWLLSDAGVVSPAMGSDPGVTLEGAGLALGPDRAWALTTKG